VVREGQQGSGRLAVVRHRGQVHLGLGPAGVRVAAQVGGRVVLVQVGRVRLEEPVPHLVAHAVGGHPHEEGDAWRARSVDRGQVGALAVGEDLGQVRIVEPLPVRLLAVLVAQGVAGVGEVGADPHVLAVGLEQRLQLGVGDLRDGVGRHPRVGGDPGRLGLRARHHERCAHRREQREQRPSRPTSASTHADLPWVQTDPR
jgi:hypothetical protein